MWIPLAVLAVLAVVGGFVGISPAFTGGAHVGGRMNIVNWLEPVIWNPSTRQFNAPHGAGGEHARAGVQPDANLIASAAADVPAEQAAHGAAAHSPYGNDTGFNLAHAVEGITHSHLLTEWVFIIISLVAGGIGIFLGLLFYNWRPHLPDLWAARFGVLYRASYNKYRVDELYGLIFTRRTMDAARGIYAVDAKGIDGAVNGAAGLTRRLSRYTGNFDRTVVDGAVNGVAAMIGRLMSPLLRAAQTGLTANYALVMVLGLVVAVIFFFSGDILGLVRGR
jgi:NADH-quinone oxidoreductase subunit L